MRGMPAVWSGELAPEVLDVVSRAAALPRGLAHLRHAPLEYVSIRLGAHPAVIERVRADLENPEIRAEAILAFVRAAKANMIPPNAPAQSNELATPRGVDAILDAVRASRSARELLASAHPEVAAVYFGVHPDLLLAARAALGMGGAGSEELA